RSGQLRPLGLCSRLWRGLAAIPTGRMGALSGRSLGVGALLWLGLGILRALGLGSVSLRPLVLLPKFVGLVAWPDLPALSPLVGSCLCIFCWLWSARRRRLRIDWLVPGVSV